MLCYNVRTEVYVFSLVANSEDCSRNYGVSCICLGLPCKVTCYAYVSIISGSD
jgi:hypothetical protein